MQLVAFLVNKLINLFLCFIFWVKHAILPFYWRRSVKISISDDSISYPVDLSNNVIVAEDFSKVPSHIAFIFPNETMANYNEVLYLLLWSCMCGITEISFYDLKGRVKQLQSALSNSVAFKHIPVKFLDFTQRSTSRNGDKKSFKVHLLDRDDGRSKFSLMIREFTKNDHEITPEKIYSFFKNQYDFLNPDLAVVVGSYPLSSYGYPPWAIRLTEFHSLPQLTKASFSDILRKYSMTEQRYGR